MTENMTSRALKRAADVQSRVDWGWFVLDGGPLENCTFCLDSAVEFRCLHVLSTAQADAESSVTAWFTRLCSWLVCFWGGLFRGHGHHTERMVALDRWGLLYCVFVLFFVLIVVLSYLLVHSICTKKLDWWAAVCLFWEEWNSVFFFFVCSHLTGLRTLRYTKNIC